ncbi:MAG: MBL fold metallo-hydrolase [Candidatus Thorarchaeota archaeon]|nr:MBL fold metallo-hydrolase [Candidatus Thorarchaeota archaeon]
MQRLHFPPDSWYSVLFENPEIDVAIRKAFLTYERRPPRKFLLMAQLTFLGSCREIGRSGFFLEHHDESVMIDYGVKFTDPPSFPDMVSLDDMQGVALTHAHLDHSGGIPRILSNTEASLYCTPATRDLSVLLLRDLHNISRGRLPYTRKDIALVKRQCDATAYEETVPLGRHFELTLFNAGHIPGSAMVSIRVNGKRVLFTGDFNATESKLNLGARKNLPKHDVVITESTYARRINPDRAEITQALIETVLETVERGGTVLIPAFAVGRSQEIMCILEQSEISRKFPVYIDGMARQVNDILVRHPEYLQSPQSFTRAVSRTRIVHDNRDRKKAAESGGIIVSPAGMLKGGASHLYFKLLHDNPKNSIIFVSFQIPGTPGAELLATKKVSVGSREFEVKAEVRMHHLSSHSDSVGLVDLLERIPGNPKFHIVHGESESCDALADILKKKGRRANIPDINDVIEI